MVRIMFALLVLAIVPSSSFAQQKQHLQVNGLKATVEILRDQWGVNHIYANNQHDLFFAQGYCAAKDRLFQFEIWRRQATGSLAEILGARELKRDIGARLFAYRGDMQTELQHYHPQGAAIINAYVDGVNAYISYVLANPGLLPAEFKVLKILPGKWTPEVVISRHQGLLGNATEELDIGRSVAKVGAEKVKQLMWFHPKEPVLTLDSSLQGNALFADILGPYNASHSEVVFHKDDIDKKALDPDAVLNKINEQLFAFDKQEEALQGSNNWIVSPQKSASGHTMLANDPHRKIAVPSLRYIVHLVAPGWNVIGGGEPEIPGVSIGHNEHGAWGLTIFETDGEDIYSYDLDPTDLTSYRYKGAWVNMKKITETIPVKQSDSVTVNLYYTVHGPVTFIDSAKHKAYSMRCAWLEPGGAPYLASLRIDQATNWNNFREACVYSHIPGENMIWADKKGNIGWQAVGITPIRNNFSGLVPVPGDGRYEWQGYLSIKERPHAYNPSKGFFATANQNVTPCDYNHWNAVGFTWADDFRGERINEVLAAKQNITIADMEALQTDYYSMPARSLVPLLQNISFTDSLTTSALQMLLYWNNVLDKNSKAASVYAMWERQLLQNADSLFVPKSVQPYINVQLTKLMQWLQQPQQIFETNATAQRDAFLQQSFEQAVSALIKMLGRDTSGWQYGQNAFKHVLLNHPLQNLVDTALQKQWNVGPLPRGGYGFTTGSTGSADNQASGASFRFITDTGNWDDALMINTPGQSGDPSSAFYKNLFPLWANDQYFPAYYSRKKIDQVAVDQLKLIPAK